MNGKILMFAFHDLSVVVAVNKAMAELGVEVLPVMPKDYNKPLQSLLEQDCVGEDDTGAPLGGPMLVLSGLTERLDTVLPALQKAGAGVSCLKAVLTAHNRKWTARQLYGELLRERMEVTGK